MRESMDEQIRDRGVRTALPAGRPVEPIAIIGMGCRLPGNSTTPERFWELLRDGKDAVTEIPRDRFDIDPYFDPTPGTPGKTHTRYGAFVEGITEMDPVFSGVAPKSAVSIDPQQRLFTAASWAAIEDAGIAPLSLEGTLTGVFVGMWSVEYWHRLASRPVEELDGQMVGGNLHCMASGALSYLLGLHGPSLSLDTACSSSMVAVDLAIQSLRSGASDLAIAGGTNVILGPENYVSFSGMQVLSADGRCKAFDASADGFGRGEGAGAVVLKRLTDALRDGDRVLAVIHGSAVTQDGRTAGIAVPNQEAQEDAARRALAQAGLAPTDVTYVEAHGTGTPVGDPIEARAVGNVYGVGRAKDDPVLLGTVKSNIAHLESAAGIASLIKVVLALQNEALPPNLHFEHPNPEIPWDTLPVQVVTELRPWKRGERPRYAAVSSFGVSGTNAHMILGEAPAMPRPQREHRERPRHLLVLSARDKDALGRAAVDYAQHLGKHPDLDVGDVCFTAATGRSPFRERLAVVGATAEELRARLMGFCDGKSPAGLSSGKAATRRPSVGFLFTGQGAQYVQMGRGLYEAQPAFRSAMDRCDEILRPIMGRSIVELIYPAPGVASPIDDTTFAQPALFALEWAVCQMWKSWGIEPDFVIGHSAGEDVAACVAGVFSLEDGLRLLAERGRLMGALPREGRMVAVMASEERVRAALEPHRGDVSIATLNGPENVVISGRTEAVEKIARAFEAAGVETRPLKVSHAFHSPLMDPMLEEFGKVARGIRYFKPRIPLVSNLTGAVAGDEITGPEHWVTHIQKPVRYSDGIAALHRLGCGLFVEVGPKPTLARISQACLPPGSGTFLPTLHQGQDDWERTLQTLGELFVRGVAVDWKAFDAGYSRRRVSLPTYSIKGQRYFVEAPKGGPRASGSWLKGLLDAREGGTIGDEIRQAGRFSEDEGRLLARLLEVFAEEYVRRATGGKAAYKAVVGGYYDTFRNLTPELENAALEEVTEAYLTFAPLPEVVPGYSWVLGMIDGKNHPEWAMLTLEAHRVLREGVFRKVDFGRVRKMLDFGCGYASDLCTLAVRHPHLEGTGYTLSVEQMKVGQKKAKRLGLEDRVRIYQRDSTKDEFPDTYDLAFGFEVAHHVPDKRALFGHISRHLNERGQVCMADFMSRTGFSIDFDDISSYFPTTEEWVDLFTGSGLLATDCVDISREMANFFTDPNFDANVDDLARRGKADAIHSLKSYDRLGHLHAEGLALYVLLTAEKRSDLSVEELRKGNQRVLEEPVPYSEVSVPHGCYELEWVRSELPAGLKTNGQPRRWLVLADRKGLGEALARRLEAMGERTVTAAWGEAYARQAADRFVLDPLDKEGFDRLLRETASGGPLAGVIHTWSVDAPDNQGLDLSSLRAAQGRGCGSVIHLVQALGATEGLVKPRILLVTEQAQPVGDGPVQVAQAPIFGVAKGIWMENPELRALTVDVSSGPVDAQVSAVLAELGEPDGETHVAYREGTRLVQRLVRRQRPQAGRPQVQAEATYLITGGTGGLGLVAARWLADLGARHLVLTSRRGAGETALEEIHALEEGGIEVRIASVDVTDERAMRALLAEVAASMPPLRGVIHAAGRFGGTVLSELSWDRFNEVLDVKVAGTFLVHELTKGMPLDFFVSYSSASAVIGSHGQSSYVAANAFQDALSHHRVRSGLPGLAVNWGSWAETGIVQSLPEQSRRALRDRGMGEIAPREAVEALGRFVAEGRPQAVVMQINWPKFVKGVVQGQVPPYFSRVAKAPEQKAEAVAAPADIRGQFRAASAAERASVLRQYLQERVATVLGYKNPAQIDRDLTLLELGFDSLMAVQLRNQIRKTLEVDVPIGKLFDSTSVDGLTDVVQQRLAAALASAQERVDVI
jgi:acyl transferase domain-containing protein/NAD(P)-dependent dehydrogenase (short-subunit alcohol dehydrogenase family)/SAM-dependent methyltransferase/acyl carrier protein